MSMLALMAMAAGTVAIPGPQRSPAGRLDLFDIPESAVRAGENGFIIYKAVVAPDGKVDRCTVEASSAEKADWEKFCSRVKRRFSFDAARDQQGAPVYYVLEESFGYVLPETWVYNAVKPDPNLVVEVARLSGATDGKIGVAVNVAVDAAGKLLHCNAAPGAAQAALSRVACEQLAANWAPMPEQNAAGQAISYVRQMQVEFRAPPSGG